MRVFHGEGCISDDPDPLYHRGIRGENVILNPHTGDSFHNKKVRDFPVWENVCPRMANTDDAGVIQSPKSPHFEEESQPHFFKNDTRQNHLQGNGLPDFFEDGFIYYSHTTLADCFYNAVLTTNNRIRCQFFLWPGIQQDPQMNSQTANYLGGRSVSG